MEGDEIRQLEPTVSGIHLHLVVEGPFYQIFLYTIRVIIIKFTKLFFWWIIITVIVLIIVQKKVRFGWSKLLSFLFSRSWTNSGYLIFSLLLLLLAFGWGFIFQFYGVLVLCHLEMRPN